MKRILVISFGILLTFFIAACGSTAVSEVPMSNSTSVASLSYISSGFIEAEIDLEEDPATVSTMFLSNVMLDKPVTTTTKVEGEIGYVNIYLDKFKVFMDDGFDAIDIDTETESDNPDYDFMFTYTVEGEEYTIYYNYDEDTKESIGILISGDVTYDLVIKDNLKEEEGETKRNMELTATSGENWITIDYEDKTEEGESKSNLEVTKSINGKQSAVSVEIKQDDEGEFKVAIEDGENSYNFKAETTDEGTHYKLDYTVDGIEGTAKIDESVDDDGNFVYSYKITEGEVTVTVEKTPPGQDKD